MLGLHLPQASLKRAINCCNQISLYDTLGRSAREPKYNIEIHSEGFPTIPNWRGCVRTTRGLELGTVSKKDGYNGIRTRKILWCLNLVIILHDDDDQESVAMPNKDGKDFLCFLPMVEKAKTLKSVNLQNTSSMIVESEKRVKLKSPDELLEVLKDRCFIRQEGWWSYEFCYQKQLQQVHVEDDKVVQEFVLGVYDKEASASFNQNLSDVSTLKDPRSNDLSQSGSPETSFAQLPAHCHNLKLKNPRSVTHIKTDRDGHFELLFIVIGAAIRSFITCMRPVIIVDGAHLKGQYLGVNLLAVTMDANNGILSIAYGVDKSETSYSWTWFMGHLRDCIGPISNLTIISDKANSIDNAVRRCFLDAFHELCVALHLNQDDSSAYAMDCNTTKVYRQTYAEIVYHIPHPSEWDIPDDLQTVLPPVMDNRLPGRPKNHDRIPSKGEEKRISTCSWCKESGHTRLTCGSPVSSQSFFPLPKYGSSSKSKAHMVSSKSKSKSKSQSQPASPFGTY
ncbi:F-box/LRR-repeat protein 14-like [Hibiscus syriacus]|uniref:F-box/LRR-repeat protein 14-like n=1 Tax=Hibiscus syriacus TaxID=106335 RepID=A0A6A2Z8I3_HIBSY|nr:F-box/LRR-repeat protein 14-like [Hibiscus syriacus]